MIGQAKDALFDAFAEVAKALGNGRRAELVDVLAQGERHVEELAAEIGQSRRQHLVPPPCPRRGRAGRPPGETGRGSTTGSPRARVGELWAALRDVGAAHHDQLDDAGRRLPRRP